jgi:hypothetical protein
MSNERPHDDTVSAAYRELASEQSPTHLDKAVLRLAENHVQRANYSRSVFWARPLAWAATIALCLAITMEITRVPTPEETADSVEAGPLPETDDATSGLAEKLENAPAPTAAYSDDRAAAAPARNKRADDDASPAASFELLNKDTPMLRQAEEMARLQIGTNAEERERPSGCPEEDRAEPASWLLCIESLEEIGDYDAAALERESLEEIFTDFKLP